MINRRALCSGALKNPRSGHLLPRFRPIAPKPASGNAPALSQPISSSSSSRKRSPASAAAPAANSPRSKRLKCSAAAAPSAPCRPLIPRVPPPPSPSPSSVFTDFFNAHHQEQQLPAVPELKTLELLPDLPAALDSSPSTSSGSTSSSEEEEEALTELSLSAGSSRSNPAMTSSSSGTSGAACSSPCGGGISDGPMSSGGEAEKFEKAYAWCNEAVVLSSERGGVLWCNRAYREAVSRGDHLGLPIPLCSYAFGGVLWMFSKTVRDRSRGNNASLTRGLNHGNISGEGGPLKPQPVRASVFGVLLTSNIQ